MSNQFYTIMVVPEKSESVRKLVIPNTIMKATIFGCFLLFVLSGILIFDYVSVLNQVNENKRLRVKNRMLLQQVQDFKNRMQSIDDAMDRIKTFSTKLRIITNLQPENDSPSNPIEEHEKDTSSNQNFNAPFKSVYLAPIHPRPYWIGGEGQMVDPEEKPKTFRITAPSKKKRTLIEAAEDLATPESEQAKEAEFQNWKIAYDEAYDAEFNEDLRSLADEFERMSAGHDILLRKSEWVEHDIQDLYEKIHDQKTQLTHTPMGRPDKGGGWITSQFGWRLSPYDGRRKMHEGIDIAGPYGTKVHSTADGIVIFSGIQGGFGKIIVIDHGYGVKTYFGHNSRNLVRKGQRVKRGQLIAKIGSTGRSTGPHLHYEVRVNGVAVDPYPYLLDPF